MIIFPQINGIRIVILWRWPVSWRGHVTKVASLRRENGDITEVDSLIEGD